MLSFTDYLEESYSFLPKAAKDIENSPMVNAKEVAKAFDMIMAMQQSAGIKKPIEDPFAIDLEKPKSIKVHRNLDGIVDLKALKDATGVSFSFGNGSRGNAGANNRGNAFESRISKDLGLFIQTRDLNAGYEYPKFMKEFAKEYLMDAKDIRIIDEGALNKKRPLQFSGGKLSIESPQLKDIGKTVTDVTVIEDEEPIYLSLKLGSTVTFFNIGISKFLNKADLSRGAVTNTTGKALLDLFTIDHDRYVRTFNEYDPKKAIKGDKSGEVVDVTSKVNIPNLIHFLSTGIGYGYVLVHAESAKPGADIRWFKMTDTDIKKHVTPTSVKVKYPSVGSAKRIDIFVETQTFSFKINIRNKQGGIAPSHIMCDYKIKH